MAFIDLIADDVSDVFLDTEELAESWTRRPLGVAADDETVTVIPGLPMADRQEQAGRNVAHRRTIQVASAQTAVTDDQWLDTSSNVYETLSVGHPEAGLKTLELLRVDDELVNDSRMVI